jgi:hypothetical protein
MFKFKTKTSKEITSLKETLTRLAKSLEERTTRRDEKALFIDITTEKQYVDTMFAKQKNLIKELQRSVKILTELITVDYKILEDCGFLPGVFDSQGDEIVLHGDRAREWLREAGYIYKTRIPEKDELWIKVEK